ncbi:hypothetical protein F2Q68_00010434 [Brassica cretica]|uniref:Uncharacterized protein n=1 Tax=Brassica cretica TaxID=69181 RepID=A0A8S9KQL2_BRACR|nr:hypothetical protein F2Q68_00010434 [Brassica cretica]
MSGFLPAVFRPRRRLLRVISACSSASSSCSTYKISSSIMGLLNGESSRAVWLLALLGFEAQKRRVGNVVPARHMASWEGIVPVVIRRPNWLTCRSPYGVRID